MYVVNQGYFLGFIIRGWALYDYTAEECQGYSALGKYLATVANVPAIFAVLLILSTPLTATIFHFAPDKGYYNCYMYPIIYFCTYFYIAMSLLCVFLRWKNTDSRLKGSMLGYNAVLIAGHARSLGYTLVTNNVREFGRVAGLLVEDWKGSCG